MDSSANRRSEKFVIPGRFPSLNDYVAAERRNRFAGATMKREETRRVASTADWIEPFTAPVSVSFRWVESSRRRDLDNIFFAKKFILDGLVAARVLEDDDARHVVALHDEIAYDSINPRVEVVIEECT